MVNPNPIGIGPTGVGIKHGAGAVAMPNNHCPGCTGGPYANDRDTAGEYMRDIGVGGPIITHAVALAGHTTYETIAPPNGICANANVGTAHINTAIVMQIINRIFS